MGKRKFSKWIPQKSAKIQFEEWVKAQESMNWAIELRSALVTEPNKVDMEVFAGPLISNDHLQRLLQNITWFKKAGGPKESKPVEVATKEGLIFHFVARPEDLFPCDEWGNKVVMGSQIILKDDCKYIGFAQVNRKKDWVRFAANKTFWSQEPLSSLNEDDIPEFIAWIDEHQADPGMGALVSAIRERNIWIKDELTFTCFYMTTNKPLRQWAKILDLWLEEVNS